MNRNGVKVQKQSGNVNNEEYQRLNIAYQNLKKEFKEIKEKNDKHETEVKMLQHDLHQL